MVHLVGESSSAFPESRCIDELHADPTAGYLALSSGAALKEKSQAWIHARRTAGHRADSRCRDFVPKPEPKCHTAGEVDSRTVFFNSNRLQLPSSFTYKVEPN